MKLETLFMPDAINDILKDFPHLRENITSPDNEGIDSKAFPKARKSERQIYRILANQHYPHLQELLDIANLSLSLGYKNPALLRTRGQSEFAAAVSELFIAQHYAASEYSVIGLDVEKDSDSTGDLELVKDNKTYLAEIYAPRIWYGLEIFIDQLSLFLKYLDLPLDYMYDISMRLIKHFDENGGLLHFEPDIFSNYMDNGKTRKESLNAITTEILKLFQDAEDSAFEYQSAIDDLNTSVKVRIKKISKSSDNFPNRFGSSSPPTLTGYVPESIFENMLKNKITNKLAKNQVQKREGISKTILIIDISRMSLSTELNSEYYFDQFAAIAKDYSENNNLNVDCVIIGNTISDAKNPFIVYFAVTRDKLGEENLTHLSNTNLIKESDYLWKSKQF